MALHSWYREIQLVGYALFATSWAYRDTSFLQACEGLALGGATLAGWPLWYYRINRTPEGYCRKSWRLSVSHNSLSGKARQRNGAESRSWDQHRINWIAHRIPLSGLIGFPVADISNASCLTLPAAFDHLLLEKRWPTSNHCLGQ